MQFVAFGGRFVGAYGCRFVANGGKLVHMVVD